MARPIMISKHQAIWVLWCFIHLVFIVLCGPTGPQLPSNPGPLWKYLNFSPLWYHHQDPVDELFDPQLKLNPAKEWLLGAPWMKSFELRKDSICCIELFDRFLPREEDFWIFRRWQLHLQVSARIKLDQLISWNHKQSILSLRLVRWGVWSVIEAQYIIQGFFDWQDERSFW